MSGEIEDLLNWITVEAGDAFFVPAGTVHAIGRRVSPFARFSSIPTSPTGSTITAAPRELHLDKALQVASLEAGTIKAQMLPIDCPYFHTELARIVIPLRYVPEAQRFHILIFISGMGTIAEQPFQEGEAWLVPAGAEPFTIIPTGDPVKFLRTWVP